MESSWCECTSRVSESLVAGCIDIKYEYLGTVAGISCWHTDSTVYTSYCTGYCCTIQIVQYLYTYFLKPVAEHQHAFMIVLHYIYMNCTRRPHSSTYCPHPCWPTPGRATPAAPQCRTIWPRHLAADKRSPAAFLRIHTYHTGLLPLSVPVDGRRHHSRSPAWQPRHHGRREPSRCGQPADRVGRLPQGPGPAAQSAAGFLQAVFGAPACTLASAAALRPLGSGIPVSPLLSFCGFGRICLTQYSQRLLDTAARPCAGKSALAFCVVSPAFCMVAAFCVVSLACCVVAHFLCGRLRWYDAACFRRT